MRCTLNAVPTKGGAKERRSIASTAVMLFKGPYARQYTQHTVHPKGGAPELAV